VKIRKIAVIYIIIIIIHTFIYIYIYIYGNPETGHDIINNGISGLEATAAAAGANEPYASGVARGVAGGSLLNIGRRLVGGHVPPNPRLRRRDRPLVTSGRPSVRPSGCTAAARSYIIGRRPHCHRHRRRRQHPKTASKVIPARELTHTHTHTHAHTRTLQRANVCVSRFVYLRSLSLSLSLSADSPPSLPATGPAVHYTV
jgi:hypothetical protein